MSDIQYISATQKRALLDQAFATLPPHQVAEKLAVASILPIAEQMVEKSFARKMFIIDTLDGPAAIYQTKKRQVAVTVPKYGAPPQRIVSYPRITVVPYYIQVQPEIELSDLMDAQFDATSDIMADAGSEMAVKEDNEFLRLFNLVAPDGGTTSSTVPPTLATGPGGIGFKLSTNNYRVGTSSTAPAGGITGDPAASDFMAACNFLRSISYNPTLALFHPVGLGKFMSQQAFLFYLNFGTREVQEQGYVTEMLGTKVTWSPLVPTKTCYIMDTYEFVRLVEREPLTVKPEFRGLRASWLVYERVAPFVRNANAVLRMTWYV